MDLDMNPLDSAKAELERLLERRIEIDRKLDAVQGTIKLLEPLYGRDAELNASGISLAEALAQDDLGITAAVERALMSKPYEPLYPTQVRDLLTANGFGLKGENPMATIHTILKRLAAKPDSNVIGIDDNAGKTMYKCTHVVLRPPQPSPRSRATSPPPHAPPALLNALKMKPEKK
jgi:hypothetical protein